MSKVKHNIKKEQKHNRARREVARASRRADASSSFHLSLFFFLFFPLFFYTTSSQRMPAQEAHQRLGELRDTTANNESTNETNDPEERHVTRSLVRIAACDVLFVLPTGLSPRGTRGRCGLTHTHTNKHTRQKTCAEQKKKEQARSAVCTGVVVEAGMFADGTF